MKKISIYLLLVLSLFIMTGCAKEENGGSNATTKNKILTCTREEVDENGYTSSEKLEIEYNSKVVKTTSTLTQEVLAGYADLAISAVESFEDSVNKLKGISVNYTAVDENHYQVVFKVEFDKVDLDELEDAFGQYYDEEAYYNKKEYTIDEFKEEYLDGYECK